MTQSSFDKLLRPARPADLPHLYALLTEGAYVHSQLDWWRLEEWIETAACIVAASHTGIAGLSIAAADDSPVAWWRVLALEASQPFSRILAALTQATLDQLSAAGARALVCMAFSVWLEDVLPELHFEPLTQVITLRKSDWRTPPFKNQTVIRSADQADLPDVLAVDNAAFDITWRYGRQGLAHMWPTMAHMVVAEREQHIIGYACGSLNRLTGHVVRLAVQPAQQGQQVGAHLLAEMVRRFYADGVQAVTLNTQRDNIPAHKLYRRFGFRALGQPVTVWRRMVAANQSG